MGGIGLSSGKNCTVGRLVANPWASQQHDGGRVVEIGGVYPLGVHFNHPARVVLDSLPCAPSQWARRPKKLKKSKHKTKTSPKRHCDC